MYKKQLMIIFLLFFVNINFGISNNNLQNEDDKIKAHITKSYNKLYKATNKLVEENNKICQSKNNRELQSLRKEFKKVLDRWMYIQHIRFGPINDFNYYYMIQFWPDKHNVSTRQFNKIIKSKPEDILDFKNLTFKSVAIQGLTALERVLYLNLYDEDLDKDKDYLCLYALSISKQLNYILEQVTLVWKDDKQISSYLENDEYLPELINSISAQIYFINKYKIKLPIENNKKAIKINKLESWQSGHSIVNIKNNINALQYTYKNHIEKRLSEVNYIKVNAINLLFIDIQNLLKKIPLELNDIINSPDYIKELIITSSYLDNLYLYFKKEIPLKLNIPASFNSLDGD